MTGDLFAHLSTAWMIFLMLEDYEPRPGDPFRYVEGHKKVTVRLEGHSTRWRRCRTVVSALYVVGGNGVAVTWQGVCAIADFSGMAIRISRHKLALRYQK